MPRITIHVSRPTGEDDHVTFSERVSAANLESEHYTSQLIDRIAWATADAEAIETGTTPLPRARPAGTHVRRPQIPVPEQTRVHAEA
jgi:hypothetical protein